VGMSGREGLAVAATRLFLPFRLSGFRELAVASSFFLGTHNRNHLGLFMDSAPSEHPAVCGPEQAGTARGAPAQ